MNDNIFIVFNNKKVAVSIAKILIGNGNNVVYVAKSINGLLNTLNYYNSGIIITGCMFDGMRTESIMGDISDDFNIILLGKKNELDNFYDGRAFKLSLPLQKNDLICSVEMLMNSEHQHSIKNVKNYSDEKIIFRAKQVLIDMYSLSEEEAYRYIQKKSMDTGRKMVDVAKIILGRV